MSLTLPDVSSRAVFVVSPSLVLLLLSGCTFGKSPVTPPDTTPTTPPDTTTPTDSPPTDSRPDTTDTSTTGYGYDWETVNAWQEGYIAEIRAAGVCPSVAPDRVVQMDGRLAAVQLVPFEPVDVLASVTANLDDYDGFWMVASEGGERPVTSESDCEAWVHGAYLPEGGRTMDGYFYGDVFPLPLAVVAHSGSVLLNYGEQGSLEDWTRTYYPDSIYDPPEVIGAGFSIMCLDAFAAPNSLDWGPASYSGAVLTHIEVPDGSYDIFWTFDEVDCAYSEDAGTWRDCCGNARYEPECDGEDNDLDGEIDEGAEDLNRDGIADCQQGIPAQ